MSQAATEKPGYPYNSCKHRKTCRAKKVCQIYITHQDEIMCSEKTLYNYLDAGLFDVCNGLQDRLGIELFQKLFPLILTDNGSEFSNSTAVECDTETGEIRTKVFYGDAGKPYQKGAIEVNHELIRRVLTDVLQKKKLNDRSPYETFSFYHGEKVLKLLGCSEAAAADTR